MNHLQYWINSLLDQFESTLTSDEIQSLLEKCGSNCAKNCGVLKSINWGDEYCLFSIKP